jgi:hypothetical protein
VMPQDELSDRFNLREIMPQLASLAEYRDSYIIAFRFHCCVAVKPNRRSRFDRVNRYLRTIAAAQDLSGGFPNTI